MALKESDQYAADKQSAAIADLMQLYFDSIYDGDVSALREIFHPENRLAGILLRHGAQFAHQLVFLSHNPVIDQKLLAEPHLHFIGGEPP